MATDKRPLYKAKEFSSLAGVSVRTLHFYDRVGLLKPAERTESGYRLYGENELGRLEQILALRFVGFPLDAIKRLGEQPERPLAVALHMQRAIIAQQRRQLDRAIDAIDRAYKALECESPNPWDALRPIIEVFRMEQDYSWTQNCFNEEDRAKLENRRSATASEVIEQGQRDWAALLAEVEAAKHEDPASDHAQSLARRWGDLVGQFTRGDSSIQVGLNRLWSDSTHWPADFKRPWSDDADAFIKKAMACLQ